MNGLNVAGGQVTYKAVADALGHPYTPPQQALGGSLSRPGQGARDDAAVGPMPLR